MNDINDGRNPSTEKLFFSINDDKHENPCMHITNISAIHNCNLTVYSLYPPELLWFGTVCCIIFTFLGTIGNFISVLALVRSPRLRNATTAFIVNLCVSDLLFCSFSIPLTAVTYIDRKWNGSDQLCKMFAFIRFTNGITSIFTVVAITINRYVLIVYPKIYPFVYTKRKTAIMIFFLWFLPLFLLLLPYLEVWGTLRYDPEVGDCGVMDLNNRSPRTFIFVVSSVFPTLLFIACYVRIYFIVSRTVRKVSRVEQRRPTTCTSMNDITESFGQRKNSCVSNSNLYINFRERKDFRLLRIILVIFILFVLSTFPLAYVKLFRKEYDLPVLNILSYIAIYSSSVVNPLIYIAMSEDYRRAYIELFRFKSVPISEG